RPVVEVVAAVELVVETIPEILGGQPVIRTEAQLRLRRRALVAIPVAVGVVAEVRRIDDRVEAVAAPPGELHGTADDFGATRRTGRCGPRIVCAIAGRGIRMQAAAATPGEHLDDAADRIRAVQARRRAAEDLDPLDLVRR